MSKQQLPTNTPINESGDEDYFFEQFVSESKLTEQYWADKAEETMDRINAYYDIIAVYYRNILSLSMHFAAL
jgi:hypothetical protein